MDRDPLEDVAATDPGDAFEEVFWNLLRRRYRPQDLVYLPAELNGDHGIEGYSTDGTAYQCYADRDSLTLRNRTDKQKKKLYEDTIKLKKNEADLCRVLGDVVLDHYFLCVPQYHSTELVAYAAGRAEAVRSFGLSFISDSFQIRIKVPSDYPAELAAAMRDGAAQASVPEPVIDDQDVDLFSEEKPQLVQVLESKLAVLVATSPGADLAILRNRLIRAFLAKEQLMGALSDYPETWEAVERRRVLRQEELELESELSPDAPDRRVSDLVRTYRSDLVTHVGGVREPDAQRLAWGQTSEWLMRCPLRFRTPS